MLVFAIQQCKSVISLFLLFNHHYFTEPGRRPSKDLSVEHVQILDIQEEKTNLHMIFFGEWVKSLSGVWLFATLWTVALQSPLSMGFSRQEYWSGLPFPPPGYLPNPGVKPVSPVSPALAGRFFTTEPPGKPNSRLACLYLVVYHFPDICLAFPIRLWKQGQVLYTLPPLNT